MTRAPLVGSDANGFLLDTSVFQAYQRSRNDDLVEYVDTTGLVACITPVLEGEYKFAARSPRELAIYEGVCRALVNYPMTEKIGDRAVAIIDDLGVQAHIFGAVQITDALVAAVALEHELEILHNDRDFEHIARVRPALRHRRFRL